MHALVSLKILQARSANGLTLNCLHISCSLVYDSSHWYKRGNQYSLIMHTLEKVINQNKKWSAIIWGGGLNTMQKNNGGETGKRFKWQYGEIVFISLKQLLLCQRLIMLCFVFFNFFNLFLFYERILSNKTGLSPKLSWD